MAAAAMVIGTTQATGKTEKETALQADAPMRCSQGCRGPAGHRCWRSSPAVFEPRSGARRATRRPSPARRRGTTSGSAARICLIAAGDMSSPEVATSTVSISSAATTMRAKPARLRAATSASRIRRCVASLIWSVARKCRRDLHAEAIRGRRAARPFEPSTGFTCRNAFYKRGLPRLFAQDMPWK